MYLCHLEKEEKQAFYNIAVALVNSDGIFSPEEKNLLDAAASEMKLLEPVETHTNFDISEECKKFKNKKSQKIVAIELLMLSFADGSFSKSEEEIIEKILVHFNLDETFLYDASQLAHAVYGLFKTGSRLISEDVYLS